MFSIKPVHLQYTGYDDFISFSVVLISIFDDTFYSRPGMEDIFLLNIAACLGCC